MDIRQFPLFSALTPEQAAGLQQRALERSHAAGTTLFQAGQPASGFYLIVKGAVKIYKVSPDGREVILNVFQSGQSFAEAAVFQGSGFPASAQCVQDSILVYLSREAVLQQIRETPELAFWLMSGLSAKLRSMVRLVEDLTLRDARGRLCRYLLDLLPEKANAPAEISLPFPQSMLARMLGITGETMSRTLKSLHEEGLVQNLHQGRLAVPDPALLEEAVGLDTTT